MLFAGNLNFRVLHKSEIIKMKYRRMLGCTLLEGKTPL